MIRRLSWATAVLLTAPLVLGAADPVHEPARALAAAARSIHLAAGPNEQLSQLLNLTLFGSFEPGMTPAEAQARFGPPMLRLADAHDRPYQYLRYRTAQSFVDVAYEPSGSACATYHRRSLYATPLSGSWAVADVVQPAFLARTRFPPGTTQVGIAGHGERAWLLLSDGRVSVVNWLREAGASTP